jgi:hypothetical protein
MILKWGICPTFNLYASEELPMIVLTDAEVTEIKSLLVAMQQDVMLSLTYRRRIASCLVILSKHPT